LISCLCTFKNLAMRSDSRPIDSTLKSPAEAE
jgi:hypothetical protein